MPAGTDVSGAEPNSPRELSAPFPDVNGTMIFVAGTVMAALTMTGTTLTAMASHMAWGVGISLAISLLFDARHGWRNVVRADALMLVALYGLVFAEFLFPQTGIEAALTESTARIAVWLTTVAMLLLAIGRHLTRSREATGHRFFVTPVPPAVILTLFWLVFMVGFLHQWVAVNFNPIAWIDYWGRARFSQPWTRGMIGDWSILLHEFGLLLLLVSPIGALILVRRRRYSRFAVIMVGLATLLTIFFFFTEGTRHKFILKVLMFVIVWCYFQRQSAKRVIIYMGLAFALIYVASNMILTFRQVGFWNYFEAKRAGAVYQQEVDPFFVDHNIISLGRLTEAVPERMPYLGLRVPYYGLIRPIPRAVWPGKPIGMAGFLNEALREEGASLTYSVTFIGEAWFAHGWAGVIGYSLLLGWLGGWWNRFGSPGNEDLGILIYASGFLGLVIGMRSMLFITTFALPTLFLVLFGMWILRHARTSAVPLDNYPDYARRLQSRSMPQPTKRRPVQTPW